MMTAENISARLEAIKKQIEQGKVEKTRAETNLESYTKQQEEIVSQMAELGVTPETVDAEIERLGREIEGGLKQAEELLRG
jgi:chromosome segregation ATPase